MKAPRDWGRSYITRFQPASLISSSLRLPLMVSPSIVWAMAAPLLLTAKCSAISLTTPQTTGMEPRASSITCSISIMVTSRANPSLCFITTQHTAKNLSARLRNCLKSTDLNSHLSLLTTLGRSKSLSGYKSDAKSPTMSLCGDGAS